MKPLTSSSNALVRALQFASIPTIFTGLETVCTILQMTGKTSLASTTHNNIGFSKEQTIG